MFERFKELLYEVSRHPSQSACGSSYRMRILESVEARADERGKEMRLLPRELWSRRKKLVCPEIVEVERHSIHPSFGERIVTRALSALEGVTYKFMAEQIGHRR